MGRALTRALVVQLWLPVALVIVWWFGSSGSQSLYFPPLSQMISALVTGFTDGDLGAATLYSLRNLGLGLALALVGGMGLGIVLGIDPRVEYAMRPMLDYARAVPHLAFVPVIVVALGLGWLPKVILIALGCFWPILLNTVDGVRGISPAILETARAYRVPFRHVVFHVVLPGCIPQVVAGVRIALQVGLVMLLVSEMYGSTSGLGFFVLQSGSTYAVADTWAGTILIGVIGYLTSLALLAVEHVLLAWYFQRPTRRRAIAPTLRKRAVA